VKNNPIEVLVSIAKVKLARNELAEKKRKLLRDKKHKRRGTDKLNKLTTNYTSSDWKKYTKVFCIKSNILGKGTGFSLLARKIWPQYFPGFLK